MKVFQLTPALVHFHFSKVISFLSENRKEKANKKNKESSDVLRLLTFPNGSEPLARTKNLFSQSEHLQVKSFRTFQSPNTSLHVRDEFLMKFVHKKVSDGTWRKTLNKIFRTPAKIRTGPTLHIHTHV